jgi:hypothetical protein
MGITTGGNISILGAGNVVDLNVTGPATFTTDIVSGGNAYIANTLHGKDGIFTGNLNVIGNLIYSNIEIVGTSNLIFTLGDNQTDPVYLNGGGIAVGNNNYATWLFNNATTSWQSNLTLTPTANGTLNLGGATNYWNNLYVNNAAIPGNLVGNLISGTFIGGGGNLSNIQAANIVGNVSSAQTVINNAQPNITSVGTLTTLTVSGNVYATNLFGNITGLISNAIYANTAGNASTANTVTSNLQPNINLLGTLTTLSVTGNTTTGNLLSNGYVSAQGNVIGSYVLGNGSQLTGVVKSLAGNLVGNISANAFYINNLPELSVTGNITGNYFIGNGSQLTGLPAGYANANVVAYGEAGWAGNIIPFANITYSLGNATNQWKDLWVSNNTIYINSVPITLSSSNVLTVNGANVVTANATGTSSTVGNVDITGNVSGGNVLTAGFVSATGNITANYIIGNGSQLTGLPAGYANTNAQAYFASGSSNANISITGNVLTTAAISATGNVTGNYILGNGALLTGVITSVANINSGNSNVAITAANANVTVGVSGVANVVTISPTSLSVNGNVLGNGVISATGNVTGNFFVGNGSLLTGITASLSNLTGNINWTTAGVGSPTVNANSSGTKIIFYPSTNATATNYATGIEANYLWDSVPQNTGTFGFKWYGGNVGVAQLDGTGALSVAGNISTSNISASGNINANAAPGSTRTFAVGYMTIPVNNTTSAYTLALADQGEMIYNSGNSITVTVPSNANVAFPIGSVIALAQYSTGTMSIVAQSGVTIALVGTSQVGNRTLAATGMASLTQVATNIWLATGTNLT